MQQSFTTPSLEEYGTWPLDRLSALIEQHFHNYIRKATPAIRQQLRTLCETYATTYTTLVVVEQLFIQATNDLERHLLHEEHKLFPAIEALYDSSSATAGTTPLITTELIDRLIREHNNEKTLFQRIAQLTSDFTAPEGTSMQFQAAYDALREFTDKLYRHIQLEDDMLFPAAIEMAERASHTYENDTANKD